jgi:hypothetical protein
MHASQRVLDRWPVRVIGVTIGVLIGCAVLAPITSSYGQCNTRCSELNCWCKTGTTNYYMIDSVTPAGLCYMWSHHIIGCVGGTKGCLGTFRATLTYRACTGVDWFCVCNPAPPVPGQYAITAATQCGTPFGASSAPMPWCVFPSSCP